MRSAEQGLIQVDCNIRSGYEIESEPKCPGLERTQSGDPQLAVLSTLHVRMVNCAVHPDWRLNKDYCVGRYPAADRRSIDPSLVKRTF